MKYIIILISIFFIGCSGINYSNNKNNVISQKCTTKGSMTLTNSLMVIIHDYNLNTVDVAYTDMVDDSVLQELLIDRSEKICDKEVLKKID